MTRQEISAELRRAADAMEAADDLPDITGDCTISEVCAALALLNEDRDKHVTVDIELSRWQNGHWKAKASIYDGDTHHMAATLRLAYDKLLASRREKQPPDPIAAVETLVSDAAAAVAVSATVPSF